MRKTLFCAILLFSLAALWSCGNDDDGGNPEPVNLTQTALNSVNTPLALGLTGEQFGLDFPHNGDPDANGSATVRDVFSSNMYADGEISPGVLKVKKVYKADENGEKIADSLQVVFAAFKRESGYNPEGVDWEYVVIDASTVSETNPNGVLPAPDTENRGKIQMCGTCHANAQGNDGLFSND